LTHERLPAREWVERVGLAVLFTAVGFLCMTVFSPLRPTLPPVADYLGRIGLVLLLLIAALVVRGSERYARYWLLVFGLFVLALTVSLDWVFARFLLYSVGVNGNTPAGYAALKVNECAVVVIVVLLFTRVSGSSLGSVYVQKGNLKLGLTIGLIAFCLGAAIAVPLAIFLFKGRDLSLERILSWAPWLLVFVLANAAQEELLFRGLFLRKLEPFYGRFLSNLLIAFVFTALHGAATYSSDQVLFLAGVFPLALAWGYVMQKTDGVWGSILFHAGMDIPIMLGIFSGL
jgi:membrane protease YdiL (CAAX protease family)